MFSASVDVKKKKCSLYAKYIRIILRERYDTKVVQIKGQRPFVTSLVTSHNALTANARSDVREIVPKLLQYIPGKILYVSTGVCVQLCIFLFF